MHVARWVLLALAVPLCVPIASVAQGTLQFEKTKLTVEEGETVSVTVRRTGSTAGEVSVEYATHAVGATVPGSDYQPVSGTLTFSAGATEHSLSVATIDDGLTEDEEALALVLAQPKGGATLGSSTVAIITIVDNDLKLTCRAGGKDRLDLPSGSYKLSDIRSGGMDRLGRALKLGLEVKDTPDFLLGELTVPDRTGEGERTVPDFIPNPDEKLWKATAELKFGRLFTSTADLKSIYSSAKKHKKLFDLASDRIAGEEDKVDFFLRRRSRDWGARLISGLTFTFAISERPAVDPMGKLPDAVRRRLETEDEHEETFSIKYDPLPLFNTGSHLSAGAAALAAYATTYKPETLGVESLCTDPKRPSCLREVSNLASSKKWLAALLPVFEFKTVDQFDFVEFGGRFLRSLFLEESLETYSLTWDLNRVFDRKADRTAALDAVAAVEELVGSPPKIESPSEMILLPERFLYLRLEHEGGVGKISWKIVEPSCSDDDSPKSEAFPGVHLESSVLAGYPAAVSGCSFQIVVEDSIGNVDRLVCETS